MSMVVLASSHSHAQIISHLMFLVTSTLVSSLLHLVDYVVETGIPIQQQLLVDVISSLFRRRDRG